MAMRPMSGVLRFLRLIVSRADGGELTDDRFLQAFVEHGDEAAFQSLVQRHGAMVLGVCRRVLRHDQDAEDAFQATFLVLARKAASLAAHGALGNWLYGVAYRTAMKARVAQARRCKREARAAIMIEEQPVSKENWGDLQPLLDRELERLPAKLRAPVVLCDLEGKTRAEAAQILGWPEGTLSWRLASARSLLARRLQRLGVTLPAAGLGLVLAQNASAAVPPNLIVATVEAACASSLGQAVAAGLVSADVAALTEGVLQAMFCTNLKFAGAVVLTLAFLTAGVGVATHGPFTNGAGQGNDIKRAGNNEEAVAADAQGKDPKKPADQEKLLGSWKLTTLTMGPEQAKLSADVVEKKLGFVPMMSFTADGKGINDLAFLEREGPSEFKYKLAGADKIDFLLAADKKEAVWKVEGDVLTLCMPLKTGLKRPTEFKADRDHVLFVLERAKALTPEEISKRKMLVEKVRQQAAQFQSTNNLKQIALAMHNYHDAYKALPAGAIYSKDGKTPLLSWRVAMLPFIDAAPLYNEFKLDEPWDSEHNKKLIPKMPQVYALPLAPEKVTKEGKTYYQVFTGKDTIFDGNKKMSILQITDGTSNTILVVEAKDPVIWSKPEDLTLPKDKTKIPPLGGHFKNGFNVALADGSVHFFRPDPPAATMRLLIDPNDGNPVDIEKLLQTEK